MVQIKIVVSDELRRRLKARAAMNRRTMSEELESLLDMVEGKNQPQKGKKSAKHLAAIKWVTSEEGRFFFSRINEIFLAIAKLLDAAWESDQKLPQEIAHALVDIHELCQMHTKLHTRDELVLGYGGVEDEDLVSPSVDEQ